jgi:hypothetical protein
MVVLAVYMAEGVHKAGEVHQNSVEVEHNLAEVADMATAAVGIAEEEHHNAGAERRTAVVEGLEEPRRAGHKLVVVRGHHNLGEAQEIHMAVLDILLDLLEVGMDSAVDMDSGLEEDRLGRRRSLEVGRHSPDKAVGKTCVLTCFRQSARARGPRQR